MTTTSMQTVRNLHLHLLKHADKDAYDDIDRIVFKKFAAKACNSLGRSTGGNLPKNKWFVIVQITYEAIMDRVYADRFADEMIKVACEFGRASSLGLPRFRFMMDIIKSGINVSARHGNPPLGPTINKWHDKIKNGDNDERVDSRRQNLTYIEKFAESYGLAMQYCGHWEESSRRVRFQGNERTYNHIEYVCRECAQAVQRGNSSGHRIQASDAAMILYQFAVEVHSNGDRRYIADRRSPTVTRIVHREREIYVDVNWQPYSDLLGNYHSSRQRGFDIIVSPWFQQNRRAFGMELEVQSRSNNETTQKKLANVHEALNYNTKQVGEYCFFERDGSIGEGFEIVTQPAGLDVHAERMAKFLQNPALKKGLRSHEGGSCGLHIHVGREFLTQAQIYRMQAFLNDSRNENLIRAIARRYDNGYSRIKRELAKFTALNKHSTDRYEALNITNVETVEFRIFRGSLRYESVMAALEFVNSLMTFCTPGAVSLTSFHADGYKSWLQLPPNRVDTKNLRGYLAIGGDHATNEREAA